MVSFIKREFYYQMAKFYYKRAKSIYSYEFIMGKHYEKMWMEV
jgi:hypothetical protein